jgi:hypothetical protein
MSVPQGGMSVPQGGMSVPQGGMSVPQGGMSVPQGGMSVPHTYNNIKIQLDNIKNKNNNNINITENLDLVEELDGGSIISNLNIPTNTPEGGDLIPGNDDGIDISNLIKPEVIIPLEKKIEANKIKPSTKEESSDIVIGNIDDVFSYEEKKNALNYTSTKEESEIDIEYLNILSKEELEAELKKLKN